MTISWYGQSCFKIETREATLAIDPFSKEIGLVPPRFQADLVLVTHGHFDHANTSAIPGAPQVIEGPGEYEARGLVITGIPSFHDAANGRERGLNTIYRITIPSEGITIAHLGDFGERELREETADAIGTIDILFIPVGGTYTIDGETAARVTRKIEPSIVIPMHYRIPGLAVNLAPVENFLKTMGAAKAERLDHLAIRRRDIPAEGTRVIVLTTG